MKYKLYLSFILLAISVNSCKKSQSEQHISPLFFENAKSLRADSVRINEIWELNTWTIADHSLVISSTKSDSLIFIYSLPNLMFQSNFGHKGAGPKEYHSAKITSSIGGKTFFAHDNGKRNMSELRIDDNLEDSYRTFFVTAVNNFVNVGHNLFCIKAATPSAMRLELRQMDHDDSKLIDEHIIMDSESMGDDSGALNFEMTSFEEKIAIAFDHIKRVELYAITDNKIKLYNSLGKPMEKIDRDISEYSDISSTDEYIYLLNHGHIRNIDDVYKLKSVVEVISWDGVVQYKIELDRIVNRIIVYKDDSHTYIYAMSPLSSDNIYIYTL